MEQHPKQMIVEGDDDRFTIINLMGYHTNWPNEKKLAPVWLDYAGGAENILKDAYISATLKQTELKILGIVFDADEQFQARWNRVRKICEAVFQNVPQKMPKDGLILQNEPTGPRLGVWIMPDNKRPGMLETFLKGLINAKSAPLLSYAQSVVTEARKQNAPYKDCHTEKAEIHSWLAWQDPPGQAFGRAITSLTLDPHAESAQPFVKWFLQLYGLEPIIA